MPDLLPLLLTAVGCAAVPLAAAAAGFSLARAKPLAHRARCAVRDGRRTFVVADVTGYTALTETRGDEHAAAVVARFRRRVRALVRPCERSHNLRWTGDGVLLAFADPDPALRLALRLAGGIEGVPPVRVGVHTGSAVRRRGDWFGSGVNLAARVADVAAGGEVVLTESTRAACGELPDVGWREVEARPLKNVSRDVRLFSAVALPAAPATALARTLSPAL
jgi:adenylate cyclase